MSPVKLALAGLGAAARKIHLPAYARLGKRLEVVAGCDPVAKPADFPFPVYPTLAELLARSTPDILAVVTPPDSHLELGCQGLEAGCHIFMEKPLAPSLAEADELLERGRQAGRHVVANHEFRMMRCHEAAKRLIGSAELGRLLFVAMHQTFRVTAATEAGWRGGERRRTLMDFGPHVVDLARFFYDAEPLALRARMPRPTDTEGPDHLVLLELEFPGDRVAQITLDRLTRGRHRYLDIRLDGEHGTVECSLGGRLELRAGLKPASRLPFVALDVALGGEARLWQGERDRLIARDPLDLFAAATARVMTGFLDALDSGRTPPCEGADARRNLALVLAAYDAAETGQAVVLDRA